VLSVLVSSIIPECIVLGKMSGGNYLPNRMTAYGSVVEISASVRNPGFLHSQVIETYELKIVHNCLDMTVTSLIYHTIANTTINSFWFSENLLLGRKCVQFK